METFHPFMYGKCSSPSHDEYLEIDGGICAWYLYMGAFIQMKDGGPYKLMQD